MSFSLRCAIAVVAACTLAACKREVPVVTPTPVPSGTPPATTAQPAPATTTAQPAPLPATAQPAPATPSPQPAQPTPAPGTTRAPESAKPAASATTPLAGIAITSATLGNALDADRRVTAAADTFRPDDTIFVAVETSGTAGGTLTARWTYDPSGRATAVRDETQKVAPGSPAVTEFHVRKPDGWPRGEYQVVILANGEPLATKRFSVK